MTQVEILCYFAQTPGPVSMLLRSPGPVTWTDRGMGSQPVTSPGVFSQQGDVFSWERMSPSWGSLVLPEVHLFPAVTSHHFSGCQGPLPMSPTWFLFPVPLAAAGVALDLLSCRQAVCGCSPGLVTPPPHPVRLLGGVIPPAARTSGHLPCPRSVS